MLRLPRAIRTLQLRALHIKTLSTPNENALKFVSTDGELIQERGSASIEVKSSQNELIQRAPLASRIFTKCPGVESLMIGDDFLTINKEELVHWNEVTPTVIDILTQHLASGHSAVQSDFYTVKESEGGYDVNLPEFKYDEDEEEISEMIQEVIKTRIRPAIMEDGGDIDYRGWDPATGVVYLKLQGACKSCSSSENTLKYGIESMLMHYIDEVEGVVQMKDPEEQIALEEFKKLEERIQSKH